MACIVLIVARELGRIVTRGELGRVLTRRKVGNDVYIIGVLKTDLLRFGEKARGSFILISPLRADGLS